MFSNNVLQKNTRQKRLILIIGFLCLLVGLLTGCTTQKQANISLAVQEVYRPAYATGFTITYYEGGARLIETDISSTSENSGRQQKVLVVPEGATQPQGVTYDYLLEGYLQQAVTLGSAHPGHFASLGRIDCVKGATIKPEKCFIPALKTALEDGSCVYVGSGDKMDQELIASLQPQMIFVGGMQRDLDFAQKMEESGLFCFYFGDYAESDFLGRAQWVEVIGALTGDDIAARAFIQDCGKGIDEIAQRAQALDESPQVLWFTHSAQVPHWYLKSETDYVGSIMQTLGATLICPETSSNSASLSNEAFVQALQQADCIVFGVSLNSYPEAQDITYFNKEGQVDFAQAPAYQQGRCYVVSNDWAQNTADVLQIVQSAAICLYPEEFADFGEASKLQYFGPQQNGAV